MRTEKRIEPTLPAAYCCPETKVYQVSLPKMICQSPGGTMQGYGDADSITYGEDD